MVGDLILRNFGAEYADMLVESFQEIKTEELQRVTEQRHLGSPETVIMHMGTNDLRTTRNIDFVLGEVYAFFGYGKEEIPKCRLVLSGVLIGRDGSLWLIGVLNDNYDLGLTFVDPNTWIEDGDFARDGLYLNGRGKRRLRQLNIRDIELDFVRIGRE